MPELSLVRPTDAAEVNTWRDAIEGMRNEALAQGAPTAYIVLPTIAGRDLRWLVCCPSEDNSADHDCFGPVGRCILFSRSLLYLSQPEALDLAASLNVGREKRLKLAAT